MQGLEALVAKYKAAIEAQGQSLALLELVNDRRPRKLGKAMWTCVCVCTWRSHHQQQRRC